MSQYLYDFGYKNRASNGTLYFPNYSMGPDYKYSLGTGSGLGGSVYKLLNTSEIMGNNTMRHHLNITSYLFLIVQTKDGNVIEI